MAKSVVDFQKVRKRRQRLQTVKRLSVLAGIVLFLGLVVLLNSIFIEEGVTTRISDFIESFGGTGYPIAMPGGIVRDVKNVDNSLAVLNDTNLYLYNKKGKQVLNLQQMNDNTVLLTNSSRVLTYHIGGKEHAIHSSSKELLRRELEDNIIGASLSESGVYAIVTSPRQYVARVTVYNKQFKEIFFWDSADNLVLQVSVSPKGNSMAVATVNTDGGVIESTVRFFRFNMGEEAARVTLGGELVLGLEHHGEDKVGVLTDQAFHVVDSSGKVSGSHSLGGAPVEKMRTSGGETLLLTEYKETRTQTVTLLAANGSVEAELTTQNNIRDIALGPRRVFVLTDRGIDTYNRSLELVETVAQRGVTRMHLVGGRLYYFTSDEICLLDDAVSTKAGKGQAESSSVPERSEASQSGREQSGIADASGDLDNDLSKGAGDTQDDGAGDSAGAQLQSGDDPAQGGDGPRDADSPDAGDLDDIPGREDGQAA